MTAASTPSRVALLCLLAGLGGAFWAYKSQVRTNAEIVDRRFADLAESASANIAARMQNFEFGLRGMRGMVTSHDGLPTLEQFRRYAATRDVDREFPGARGMGVIWRVPRSQEGAFLASVRSDGRPEFSIRELAAHDSERFVITYVDPEARNRQAVGLDIASEARRRGAALAALASGKSTITEPITLVQASGQSQRSFLVLLPIFLTGKAPNDGPQLSAAAGWSYAPVIIDEVLNTVELPHEKAWLELRDAGSQSAGVFYRSTGQEPNRAGLPSREVEFHVYDRRWIAHFRASPAFMADLHLTAPGAVGSVSALLALLVSGLGFLIAQRAQRVNALAVERARRAAIVDASTDGIIGVTLDGIITDWNQGAERLFGFRAEQAVGKMVKDLLVPESRKSEDDEVRQKTAAGESVVPFETERRHLDGSLIDVSVSAAPITDVRGHRIGLAKTFRDIRPAKVAQRALETLNASLAALNAGLEQQVEERTRELGRAIHDLRNIVDALPSMIGYWDSHLRIRMANKAYARWFNVDPDALKGRHISELLGPELYEKYRPFMEAALRGEPQTFERSIPRPDGVGMRHSLAYYLPDVSDGQVLGFYVLVHDVTELQEQRAALEAERRDKTALLATIDAHALVSVTDRKGVITAINERFCQISGYEAEELIGQTHRVINSGTHPRSFWRDMWRTIARGNYWRGEVCNRAKDGSLYWVDSVIAPFRDERGRINKIISLRTDITALKRAESEQRRALALLESVLKSATQVSIIAVDRQGDVYLFNQGAEHLLGYRADEVIGRVTALDWHVQEELEARAAELSQRTGRQIKPGIALVVPEALNTSFECHFRRKDGSLVPVSLSVTEILDAESNSLGFIGVAYDISSRLQHEADMRRAIDAAKAANDAKSMFLANMSHEIRTPLNAVIGLAYLLQRTALTPDQASQVQDILVSGKSLLGIVNDVLDLSKIEAGEMVLERIGFSLRDVCSELQAVFGAQARTKGLLLHLTPGADLPDALLGDPTRLRQILVNLLGNAIKFTDRGEVRLDIGQQREGEGWCRLRFEVRDTGVGISSDVLPTLFEPFAQADASTTRRFGGTGLGLSIIRQLAELMGGRVGVEGQLGQGSCFWVEIPFEEADVQALSGAVEVSESGPRLTGVRVLLADDSEINLKVASRLLEAEEARVSTARHGAEAFRLAQTDNEFDIVLMDVQMPVMDGLHATRLIHSLPHRALLPIIGLTAGNTESEHRRGLDAGLQEMWSKPIDPEALVQGVRRVLGMGFAPSTPVIAARGANWPEIDGIDIEQAQARLGGDFELFRGMLHRMLDMCDTAIRLAANSPPQSGELVATMHKLRGSSATLGAARIAEMAGEMEERCRQDPGASVQAEVAQLAEAARLVRCSAAPIFSETPEKKHSPPPDPIDQSRLRDLLKALSSNDLSAIGLFPALSSSLRATLGAKEFQQLEAQIQGLEFDAAADLIRSCVDM